MVLYKCCYYYYYYYYYYYDKVGVRHVSKPVWQRSKFVWSEGPCQPSGVLVTWAVLLQLDEEDLYCIGLNENTDNFDIRLRPQNNVLTKINNINLLFTKNW